MGLCVQTQLADCQMKCLIMSCVILCAAQDVTGERKEQREEEEEGKKKKGWL